MMTVRIGNRNVKRVIAGLTAMTLAGSLVFANTVFAAPGFARTQEEWDKLRDNTLEYTEIQGLIEEYNATVLKNNIELMDFRKKYGRTNATASERYNKTADEIMANLVEPDIDSPTYAQALLGKANSLATVDNLRKSADTSLEDYDVNYYNFEQAKMSLVQIAQTNRINLENARLSEDAAKLSEEKADLDVQNANARYRAGVATNLDVLNANEGLLNAQKEVLSSSAETENIRQKLMIMCGWSYDSHPEFTALPDFNPDEKIQSFSVEEDTKRAIENNYVLKANEKKLANAKSQSQKDSLNNTIASNKAGIANAVLTAYQSVKAAQEAFTHAKNNSELQAVNFANISGKHRLGMVSTYEMQSARIANDMAKISLQQSELALRIAINNYEWTVAGLAKTE